MSLSVYVCVCVEEDFVYLSPINWTVDITEA